MRIRIWSITMVKIIYLIQDTKKNKNRKKLWQRWKSVVQVNEQCYIRKTIENLRNRIDAKLVSIEKKYLKCTSKASYMSFKIFDNNSVALNKSKLALKLNKPAYLGMCILELIKWKINFISIRLEKKCRLFIFFH